LPLIRYARYQGVAGAYSAIYSVSTGRAPEYVRSSKTFTAIFVAVKVFIYVIYHLTEELFQMKIAALVLFIVLYIFMIAIPKYRPFYALGVAVVFLITGILPIGSLFTTINWNVLMMIAGTMIIVDYFIESQMPNLLADILLSKSKNIMWVTIYMSLFAGVISAFIDNVATVLMVAPVGIAICRKMNIKPTGMILPEFAT